MKKINPKDIAILFHQLASLVNAGIPILESLSIIIQSHPNTSLRYLTSNIRQEILSGKTLGSSVTNYPHYISPLSRQLICVGEQTGQLDVMLTLIADNLDKSLALKQQIAKTLFYPGLLAIFALITATAMLIFVIPRFEELFQATNQTLPMLTRCLFYLAAKLRAGLWLTSFFLLMGSIMFLAPSGRYYLKTLLGRLAWHLPLIRQFLQLVTLTNFTRQIACLFIAGIPITEGLRILGQTPQRCEFAHAIAQLQHKLQSGWPLHHAMSNLSIFPLLMVQMVKIGEESGKLDIMLNKVAELYAKEIERITFRFSQLLEPLIMLVLGVLIGGLVIGMYLPIFKLGSTF